MKKLMFISLALLMTVSLTPVAQAETSPAAAGLLSAMIPGAGEWYNRGWEGSFPFVECIVSAICPCVQISSVFDAVAGQTSEDMRFDFWTAPAN